MHLAKRHLSKHQRQRLVLWVLAMLSWIASVLFAGRDVTHRQLRQRHRTMSLERLKRMTIQLMVVRAGELARMRRPKRHRLVRHGRSLLRRHLYRSLLGSRLRRMMKRKALVDRVTVLIDVLRNLDAYAQLLAKRMKRRLTRIFSIAPAPMPAAPLYGPPAPSPACADTS